MTTLDVSREKSPGDRLRYGAEEIDTLVWTAVFGGDAEKAAARREIRREAASRGILPASILPLYEARSRGEVSGFTVPAINIRTLAYDTARAVFRTAKRLGAGAFIFEIARSEIGYTDQRPAEYAAVVLAAAVREAWTGPVFLQGDHFQTNAKKMKSESAREVKAIEDLILEAIAASFYQIDIDTSTLVDLSRPDLDAQQRPNYENCAHFTRFIREHQPRGVEISIGGEIGEVGKENSTPEEFRAYMEGYRRGIGNAKGLAKVSIQTGSSHGGMVAADGTLKKMSIDFDVIRRISKIAREEYAMAGAVQHGASTLPEDDFGLFPEYDTAEIHLATGFQNMVLDHPVLPGVLRETINRWVTDHAASERKPSDSPEQFLYKSRKKALGPFKEALWNLPVGTRNAIAADLEDKFAFLFEQLKVGGTRPVVDRYVHPVEVGERAAAGAFVRDDEAGD
ncbi:MAG TPA: class II fructose-bisphosphate aldolase [Thermoanaerobaculia bacterium]|nr:class II fructose-bisphosphate aldolase [Thermoanaerobaculia bacterium]